MASSHRLERINGKLQRDLSLLLSTRIKDDVIQSASIGVTNVKATPDLKEAKVYVSILGDQAEKEAVLEALKRASGFLRREIGKNLTTYNTPQLSFILDESVEYGAKIDKILDDLREKGQISDEISEDFYEDF